MSNATKKFKGKGSNDPYDMLASAPKITIADLEKVKPSDVWAINVCDVASDLLISVGSGPNETVLTLQNTWLPQNLTSQVTLDMLLQSTNFRQAVSGDPIRGKKPLIKIISSEVVEAVMVTDDAAAESEELSTARSEIEKAQRKAGRETEDEVEKSLKPTVRVAQAVARLNEGTYSEAQMASMMKMGREDLTDDDLKFIAQNATKASAKKLATKMLNRRSEKSGAIKKKLKIKRKVA